MLHAREDLMESIQNFLKRFDRISFRETPKVLTQAWDKFFEVKHAQSEEVQELLYKLLQDLQSINEELAEYINTPSWNLPTSSYDDDDDEYSFATQEYLMTCSTAITPDSLKTDSLVMVDKHLNTILETESDEFIKSSVGNLVQNPSESEDECQCDVPDCDDSQTIIFLTFSNPLFDDSTSSDDKSSHEEIASSPKIDYLFNEFADELKTIPPGIVNREYEEYISMMERLLYDNLTPRPLKAFQANSDTIIESLHTFPILFEDSNSLREEIYIFPGDSAINVVEDIPVDVPNILPTHPTLHMDFDFIPSHNDLGSDLDVSSPSVDRNKFYDPGICIEVESTRPLATHSPMIDTLLPFSSENEDKVFNHGVLASKEKCHPSLSHRGFKDSKLFHHKSPMLIHGDNTPNLGVRHPYFYPP
ncbi:hypothetical protein Tco_0731553 [Tanacetum coccineum]